MLYSYIVVGTGRLEITSGSTLNAVVEVEDGVKVWHLVGLHANCSQLITLAT